MKFTKYVKTIGSFVAYIELVATIDEQEIIIDDSLRGGTYLGVVIGNVAFVPFGTHFEIWTI